jgi:hypothetical protein
MYDAWGSIDRDRPAALELVVGDAVVLVGGPDSIELAHVVSCGRLVACDLGCGCVGCGHPSGKWDVKYGRGLQRSAALLLAKYLRFGRHGTGYR